MRRQHQIDTPVLDSVLQGLPYCFIYLDDVLIASLDLDSHVEHLREVLSRLRAAGLQLKGNKCVFAIAVVEFLGHQVTAAGISPLQKRVEAVEKFPLPGTNKQLLSFLGMINFYRRFLPQAARVLKPLTDSLRGGKAAAVEWTEPMRQSFTAAKKMLC
jgi:Reverse transcriptase (RNA-dependent DNA polymerase)